MKSFDVGVTGKQSTREIQESLKVKRGGSACSTDTEGKGKATSARREETMPDAGHTDENSS